MIRRLVVTACAVALVLGAAIPVRSDAQAMPKLRVGVMKIAALTDAWVAEQQGYFKKHGVDVELVTIPNGSAGISALQGGSLDVTLAIPTWAMAADEHGFGLVAVYQNEIAHPTPPDTGALLVAKNSSITKPAELAGRTVAVNALQSGEVLSAQTVLAKAGIPSGSVRFIEIPYPSMAGALERNQVAAAVAIDPFTTEIQSSGSGRVISWVYTETIPGQPLGAFWAKRSFAQQNGDALARFGAAMDDAMRYLGSDSKRARTLIAQYTGLQQKYVEAMPLIDWSSKVDPAKWLALVAMLRTEGVLHDEHTLADYFIAGTERTATR
jgi:NitT/TauT family transport system substrate-binding protein